MAQLSHFFRISLNSKKKKYFRDQKKKFGEINLEIFFFFFWKKLELKFYLFARKYRTKN